METEPAAWADDPEPGVVVAIIRAMRLHLLWFVPLVVAVVLYLVVPSAVSGYRNTMLVIRRFTWGIFISPAAALYFGSILASVLLPLRLLLFIPAYFERSGRSWRRLWVPVLVIIAIAVCELGLQFLVWGSFPLPADKEGYIRLTLIPFLPWPNRPFFH